MRVCPHCSCFVSDSATNCLFCGHRFSKAGANVVRFDPQAPRSRRTAAAKAERFLSVFSLFLAAIVAAVILGAPPTERQILAAGGSVASAAPAPTEAPVSGGSFGPYSGQYAVTLTLSEAASENPGTEKSADDIRGESFSGVFTLALDEAGGGTLSIDQLFTETEDISVAPFVNSDGVSSQNTLYGTLARNDMVLSVVCVCEEDGISGFIWLDSDTTHIEFLYY